VTFATTSGAASSALRNATFDVVIIDECAQATEVECWIALLKGARCVLAGDHKQLPPTLTSAEAAAGGLAITLFDRMHALYGPAVTRMLTIQYRMHRE
jgi:superfamily I DNA and/or RNA helicase